MKHRRLLLALAASFTPSADTAAQNLRPTDHTPHPAVFAVTTDVLNPGVEPFTVTGPAFGNTLRRTGKGGFEPPTFRSRFEARRDANDRVYDGRGAGIAYYDSYAPGYLDGAEVRVYRVVDGEMKLVREDRVAPGGTVIEYWKYRENKVIPPNTHKARFKWTDWSRPGATRWFTVFAVDRSGNVSAPAEPLRFEQRVADKGADAATVTERFRPVGPEADTDAPPAPEGFTGRYNEAGVLEFSWDPVESDDLAGYYLASSDTPPSAKRGVYLQLEGSGTNGGTPVRRGDMVIVSKSLASFTPDWLSHRLGNLERTIRDYIPDGVPKEIADQSTEERTWRLRHHPADTPVPGAGEFYLELTLQPGETQLVGKSGIPDISTTKQDFYPVPKKNAEYIMEVWIKADRPDRGPVVFTWDGDERVGGFVGEHPLDVTDEWTKHTVRFTGDNAEEGNHAYFVLKTSGPGTYAFDNFRIYNADAPYLDYLPYQHDNLTESGMAAFRTHGPIKTGRQTYSMRQYLGEAGQAEGVAKGNTLPQALRMMEKAGVHPWLQIEYHMSPEEWLAFVEYLAAPFDPATDTPADKPYAALRHAQGREAPWIEAFDRIYFELSNETWNGLFKPWTFDSMSDAETGATHGRGEVYAMFHDYVADVLRSSPYWRPEYEDVFIHVLGGWSATLNRDSLTKGFTQEIANTTRSGEFITIAAYNGGWDEGEGPPKENAPSYFNVLSQVNQTAIPRAVRLNKVIETAAERLGRAIRFGTYEAGPGYVLDGLNNADVTEEQAEAQEHVMKSKLSGVATLDSFLARAKYGSDIDNFFTFAEGDLWKSHAKRYRGGQPHACFLPLALFNRVATGDLLQVETRSTPTVDTAASRRRQAVDDAPLAAAYATRSGDRVAVVCINRQIPGYPDPDSDGSVSFGLELPFTKAESITLHRMTGKPTDHNIYEENVTIERVPVDPAAISDGGQFVIGPETGGSPAGLPPAEVFLYVFEGTDIGEPGRVLAPAEVRAQPTSFREEEE
ncbi:MAG: hypothetical protein GVY10_00895 [Verrucomicrobia bacterium]|jgi:hypothetical protein|nr:hypothetical protein [Verrucomicrobiota bacterium]